MPEEHQKGQESLKDKILPGKTEEGSSAPSTGENKGESKLEKIEDFVKKDAEKEANDDIWGGGGTK